MPRLSVVHVLVALSLGCDPHRAEFAWTEDAETAVVGTDPTTNDLFAFIKDGPVFHLCRIRTDGVRLWATGDLEHAVWRSESVQAVTTATEIVLATETDQTTAFAGIAIPAGPTIIRWSQADGRLVTVAPAPTGWGLSPTFITSRRLVTGIAGAVVGSYDSGINGYRVDELLAVDATGSVLWSAVPVPRSVVQTIAAAPDGAIVVALLASSGNRLVKLGIDGALVWSLPIEELVSGVTVGLDGTIYIAGGTYASPSELNVRAFSADGTPSWQTRFAARNGTFPRVALETSTDGRIIAMITGNVLPVQHDGDTLDGDPIIVELQPDGGVADWRELFHATPWAGAQDRLVAGRFGRIYIGGTTLRALDVP